MPPVASTKDAALDLLKLFLAIVVFYDKGKVSADLRNKIFNWYSDSAAYAKKVKLPVKTLENVAKAVHLGKWTDKTEENLVALGMALKTSIPLIGADHSLSNAQLSLFKDVGLFYRNGSEPALQRFFKNIGLLRDPHLSAAFSPEIKADQKRILVEVRKHLKALGGDPSTLTLHPDLSKKHQGTDKYKEYLTTRREAMDVYKKTLAQIVRQSGEPHMPVADVLKKLKAGGIELHNIPSGFKGRIGDDGKMYTNNGLEIHGGIGGGSVTMNPKYDPKTDNAYVFSGRAPYAQTDQKYYTVQYKSKARANKFEKVNELSGKINKLQTKWQRDLKSRDFENRVLAAIVETVYLTQGRIGSDSGMTAGQKTYGISTLLVKHVKLLTNSIKISYQGKKGVMQEHTIKKEEGVPFDNLMAVYKQLVAGKKSTDSLFSFPLEKGDAVSEYYRITGNDVNAYLKGIGANASIHKFRHLRGNKVFEEQIKEHPYKGEDKGFEAYIKKTLEAVGEKLGHKKADGSVLWSTSAANYVNPELIADEFGKRKMRRPNWLERAMKEAD